MCLISLVIFICPANRGEDITQFVKDDFMNRYQKKKTVLRLVLVPVQEKKKKKELVPEY